MRKLVAAFGPDGSYFFQSPSQWKFVLPERLSLMFQWDVTIVYSIALGASGSYFMAYKQRKNGLDSIVFADLPPHLASWLSATDSKGFLIRDIQNLRVSLGQNNTSYWASDGRDLCSYNLPYRLEVALHELRGPNGYFTTWPKFVTLGVDGSYLMTATNGSGAWDVQYYYPKLEADIQALRRLHGRPGFFNTIEDVVIDPYSPNNFIMTTTSVCRTGGYHYFVPPALGDTVLTVATSLPEPASMHFGPSFPQPQSSSNMPRTSDTTQYNTLTPNHTGQLASTNESLTGLMVKAAATSAVHEVLSGGSSGNNGNNGISGGDTYIIGGFDGSSVDGSGPYNSDPNAFNDSLGLLSAQSAYSPLGDTSGLYSF